MPPSTANSWPRKNSPSKQRKADLREKAIADRAALNAQKLELARRSQQEDQSLAQRKVELVDKKLQLEVRKYDDAQKAAQMPENKPLTEDEKCRKIAAVFGMNYDERMAQIADRKGSPTKTNSNPKRRPMPPNPLNRRKPRTRLALVNRKSKTVNPVPYAQSRDHANIPPGSRNAPRWNLRAKL